MATVAGQRRSGPHPALGGRTPSSNDDFFDPDELRELREYYAPLRTLKRIRTVITTALSVWLVFGLDLAPKIAERLDGQGWFIQLLIIATAFEVVDLVVKAPFSYWVNLVYERRAGHSTMTGPTWIKDQVLTLVLDVAVTAALLGILYASMHAFDQWWLIGGVGIVAVFVVFQFIAPVVIMPRFNKFTPLPEGPIRTRIEELAALQQVNIEGVYLMDASKRTTRANAGVTGFGKTKRVIVNDTICDFPIDELSQVIAHELGHYRLNHIVKSFPVTALQFPLALAFIQFVAGDDTILRWAGVSDLGDPASFGLIGVAFSVPMILTALVEKWLSRKHEREADLEALELLGDPTSFIAVWPRLVLNDKANMEPTTWEKLNSTHPEIAERMQFGLDWAAMNGVPVSKPERRSVPRPTGTSEQ